MNLLRQTLAPISDPAWAEIESEAKGILAMHLSGRKIIDVSGPIGPEVGAVNLGRLDVPDGQKTDVQYGIRKVQPMVEVRVPFTLDQWELDNIDRGARDADFDDLHRAAKEIAKFEENAIYSGFEPGCIEGLVQRTPFEGVTVGQDPASLIEAVTRAVLRLRYANVPGPYALALGAAFYGSIGAESGGGYPLSRRITDLIEGPIHLAPHLEGGVLVSQRGGDAEIILGQDISIGYENHTPSSVELYLTEAFTFRVHGPEAAVVLTSEAVKS